MNIFIRLRGSVLSALAFLPALLLCSNSATALELSLREAIEIAQSNDPWIEGSRYRQQALAAQSTAAGALPDPMVTAGFANLPTDTFDFNQEPMTQFSVGVSQALPRGNSRALRREQLATLSAQHPYQRADRRARVEAQVSGIWLDAWRAAETIRLIEKDSDLFLQLVDIAQSNYVNSLKGTRQQDLVHAESELTRLEDRLLVLREEREIALARLQQWLQSSAAAAVGSPGYELPRKLPDIKPLAPQFLTARQSPGPESLARALEHHPALQTVTRRLEASSTAIKLAEQQYRPEWRLSASYGYRDDDPLGQQRADFFSFGVSFDLPIFTSSRQDQKVISATATTESIRTEKALLLRKMIAEITTLQARLQRLNERQQLYQSRLLSDMRAQVESALEAYTNDDGDFAEVVRARIAQLNTRIAAIDIEVNRQKTLAELNYFFVSANDGQEH